MGRKRKPQDDKKEKKNSGPAGCGSRQHLAVTNPAKTLTNAAKSNGLVEAFLIALDAEDAKLPGAWLATFSRLETEHRAGIQLVEAGNELAVGKSRSPKHYRTADVWEPGPASWMVAAKERLAVKLGDEVAVVAELKRIGEGYARGAQVPKDVSYRRVSMVAKKLDELGLPGSSALQALETEAAGDRLPWFLESIGAAERLMKAERDRKEAEERARQQEEANRKKQTEAKQGKWGK